MRSAASRNVLALLAVLAISCFFPLSLVGAQTQPPPPSPDSAAAPMLPNTVNCFDYYHFGSVQVDITSTVGSVVSGTPITFTGTIKSNNTYPIVDGEVYIKIFRERGDGSKDSNGPDVVDQFYAKEGISLPADGEQPINITWDIPSYAISGEYKVATFFTVSHKFNLLGLPFTDDVVGNTASFKVSGEQKASVGFKKDAVTVRGEQYHFAAFPPRTPSTGTVTVEAYIANTTDQSVTVPVTWTLNAWSGNDTGNVLDTRTQQVTIPAGDGLQCGALSDLGVGGAEKHCVAVNPGTVTPIFNMADTSGIFYYRYFLSGCMGHNIGMIYRPTTKGEMMYGLSMGQVPPDPVNVDAESIPYPLTIIPGSMPRSGEVNPYPPSTPVISGGSCQVGSPHSLSFTSTDPAGHQLKYGIDWDADGSIDQYVPPTGYVNSGTTQSASRTYSIAGQKQIRVVAINDHGMQSTWASKTFTCQVSACLSGYVRQGDRCVRSTQCTTPPHCEANDLVDSCTGETIRTCDWGCAAGACKAILAPSATLKAVPLLVHAGNTSSVSWTSFNTTSCTVSGANGDSWTGLSSTGKTSSPILSQTIYRLHCIGHAGANPPTIDKSVVINIIPSFNEK